MAKTGVSWKSNPKNFGIAVHARVYKLTRETAEKAFDLAVKLSPVDTGAYRASWAISEGAPVYKWVGRQKKGSELPPPSRPALSTKFYRKFYVTNGAPYAYKLEHGWSDQAPLGVVRQVVSALK